jgi:hypothetical protein
VEGTLAKYAGREKELFAKLDEKYKKAGTVHHTTMHHTSYTMHHTLYSFCALPKPRGGNGVSRPGVTGEKRDVTDIEATSDVTELDGRDRRGTFVSITLGRYGYRGDDDTREADGVV